MWSKLVSLGSLVTNGGVNRATSSSCRPKMSILPSGLSQSFGAPKAPAGLSLVFLKFISEESLSDNLNLLFGSCFDSDLC